MTILVSFFFKVMYQSQQSQIYSQCFQHLAPHTDKLSNSSFQIFQIFPLEVYSSISY